MPKPKLHLEILDRRRLVMLPKLKFLSRDHGFYLAGGTALALQIGHRTSVDFDFYSPRDFSPRRLFASLEKALPGARAIRTADGTLISEWKGIELTFFRYEYKMLKSLLRTEYLDLASVEDIAAMKMIAIVQRGKKRDFVDMHYLLCHHGLEEILTMTGKKYNVFNRYMGLRALTYFADAEQDEGRASVNTLERLSWERVKRELISTVGKYAKQNLLKA